MIDFAWKRVRVRTWGRKRGQRRVFCIDCKRTQLEKDVWGVVKTKTEQLTSMLTGVAVPVEDSDYPGKLVVLPMEFRSAGWDWVKIDPTIRYFVVLKRDVDILGDAYAHEIDKVLPALKLFGFKVDVPDKSRSGKGVTLTPDERRALEKLYRRLYK